MDRLRHHARRPLARTPYAWDVAMLLRPGKRETLAGRRTAIVIDGFLRSGNTYSVAAFRVANGPRTARRPPPARWCRTCAGRCGCGLPTVVLIRRARGRRQLLPGPAADPDPRGRPAGVPRLLPDRLAGARRVRGRPLRHGGVRLRRRHRPGQRAVRHELRAASQATRPVSGPRVRAGRGDEPAGVRGRGRRDPRRTALGRSGAAQGGGAPPDGEPSHARPPGPRRGRFRPVRRPRLTSQVPRAGLP